MRVLIVLGAIGLIAILALGAQCSRSMQARDAQDAPELTQEQEQQRAEQQRQEALDAALGEDAVKMRSEYDDQARELIGILQKSAWVASNGDEVAFTETSFAEKRAGEDIEETPYVITSTKRTKLNSADKQIDQTIAAIQVPDGTHLMTLTYLTQKDSETWTLSCDALDTQGDLQRHAAATDFAVVGDEDMATTLAVLLGGDTSMLEDLLKDYCALYYPSASEARWSGAAEADWASQTVTTDFTLNNSAKTHVLVTYRTDTASYEFG